MIELDSLLQLAGSVFQTPWKQAVCHLIRHCQKSIAISLNNRQ
jgi:hypothetical protein